MGQSLYEALLRVDTPTVCNSIEVVQGARGFNNFSKKTMYTADVGLPPIVGFARTARIRAAEPPTISPDECKQIRMGYYRYMSEGPRPGVCVIQDIDYPNCVGSFWGEINNYSHRALGLSGTLTDGLMRDLDALAPNYQVLAGGIGPSHAFVHVLDYDVRVNVLGLSVAPGDLIHADRHGAVVIPEEVLPDLEGAIETLIACENIILNEVKERERMSFEEFSGLWQKFEQSRT
ncbi:MAG: RraA family protein [Spirochaetota bacterium]